MQVRPRAVLLPIPRATHHGRATTSSSATTTGATIPVCSGANPYYPALLSDALIFLGGGLGWGLAKASAAANLSPPPGAGTGEGSGGVAGDIVSEVANSRGGAGGEAGRGDPAVEASLLQGKPSAALLLMTHILRIDVGELEAASAMQVKPLGGWKTGIFFYDVFWYATQWFDFLLSSFGMVRSCVPDLDHSRLVKL